MIVRLRLNLSLCSFVSRWLLSLQKSHLPFHVPHASFFSGPLLLCSFPCPHPSCAVHQSRCRILLYACPLQQTLAVKLHLVPHRTRRLQIRFHRFQIPLLLSHHLLKRRGGRDKTDRESLWMRVYRFADVSSLQTLIVIIQSSLSPLYLADSRMVNSLIFFLVVLFVGVSVVVLIFVFSGGCFSLLTPKSCESRAVGGALGTSRLPASSAPAHS